MLQHLEDEIRADIIDALADAEDLRREMADFARGRCPYCDTGDGMALFDAEQVRRWLSGHGEAEYARVPYYWRDEADGFLASPCGYCNFGAAVPPEYRRVTLEQARLWALRQRRLERRETKGAA